MGFLSSLTVSGIAKILEYRAVFVKFMTLQKTVTFFAVLDLLISFCLFFTNTCDFLVELVLEFSLSLGAAYFLEKATILLFFIAIPPIIFILCECRKTTAWKLKELNRLHQEGRSVTRFLSRASVENGKAKEIEKWRNKVKKIIPETLIYNFDNLPDNSIEGPLHTYWIELHRHSQRVLADFLRSPSF